MPEPAWALQLFRRSVLKQRKYAEIQSMLGPTAGARCLDLGSDNGVVSLLLRRGGGEWASADVTDEAVASIRELVGEDVHQVREGRLPFGDASFDAIVVVDMLEHVRDEADFVSELARALKPGGRLVINTPHLKRTLLRRFRHESGSRSCSARIFPSTPPTHIPASSRSSWTRPSTGRSSGWASADRRRGWS
jgi:2-polyprenyl-3-methyl-5-hydroxy-6-metoxy-1,4-benzoquinol methylase